MHFGPFDKSLFSWQVWLRLDSYRYYDDVSLKFYVLMSLSPMIF